MVGLVHPSLKLFQGCLFLRVKNTNSVVLCIQEPPSPSSSPLPEHPAAQRQLSGTSTGSHGWFGVKSANFGMPNEAPQESTLHLVLGKNKNHRVRRVYVHLVLGPSASGSTWKKTQETMFVDIPLQDAKKIVPCLHSPKLLPAW